MTHPSFNNYLALLSGQTYPHITDGCLPSTTSCSTNTVNLADRIEASGRTWHGYMEDMPSACFNGQSTARYVMRHNPFPYFNQIRTMARCQNYGSYSQLATDLASGHVANSTG